jgi:hypothetical protein
VTLSLSFAPGPSRKANDILILYIDFRPYLCEVFKDNQHCNAVFSPK